ncbi:hypothetical protein [Comamonas thiooxydans]|uniref:hypothetical protein n=1 Tax=Comamonas thiooxydans TaxID=363952 RepID=UPI001555B12D|nr:hypothetical protein [Comamonas thiooxydans]
MSGHRGAVGIWRKATVHGWQTPMPGLAHCMSLPLPMSKKTGVCGSASAMADPDLAKRC